MTRTEVHKFGGTSLADADRMRAAAGLVRDAAANAGVVVVASAMGGVTDQLVEASELALAGDATAAVTAVDGLRARHETALAALAGETDVTEIRASLDALLDALAERLRSVAGLRELSPRVRAAVLATGEKLSVRLLAVALRAGGHLAESIDADTFLETEGGHAAAAPVHGVAERMIASALRPRLDKGLIPVVTGFCGRGPDGSTTLLGRGGSDYTATLIGAALGADEVTIWTDVDGVYSADPRIVPDARPVRHLNFREAGELSHYGAKVLHQRTIVPVEVRGIPIRIANTLDPERGSTVIDGRFTPGSHPVKAISAIRRQALVSLEGNAMAGVPGVAARLFAALAGTGISVTMISQGGSECSICIAVPEDDAVAAELALRREFRTDFSYGEAEEVTVQRGVGIVAAVGLGMAHTPGVAAGIFQAVASRRVNVHAIAQGASELNVSLAVDEPDVEEAVRALHRHFALHLIDTGQESPAGLDLMLLGCGQVGRGVIDLVLDRESHVFERFGLEPAIVAVCDSSGFVFAPTGLTGERLRAVRDAKCAGARIADLDGGVPAESSIAMVRHVLEWRLRRPVLVDVSNHPDSLPTFLEALRGGCDVVTANKAPLAGPFADYRALRETADESDGLLRAEATVGAGLPVVETLEMLLATGDRLHRVEGCLSGTLAFLMTRLEAGARFSEAVVEAVELGYTEPDPVVDLSGVDVERKAVILARLAGLAESDVPITREGLVDPSLAGLPQSELLARLRAEYDEPLAKRIEACASRQQVLRFIGRVGPDGIEVGPVAVPDDSPLGMLRGPDNMVVIHSDRYDDRPLVVSGPGAGVSVTATGVLSDVLRIAAERR